MLKPRMEIEVLAKIALDKPTLNTLKSLESLKLEVLLDIRQLLMEVLTRLPQK